MAELLSIEKKGNENENENEKFSAIIDLENKSFYAQFTLFSNEHTHPQENQLPQLNTLHL